MTSLRTGLVGVLAVLLGAACNLTLSNGGLKCSTDGDKCPPGYHCAADKTCWKDGEDPTSDGGGTYDLPPGDLAGGPDQSIDLNEVDAFEPPPPDLLPGPDIQPILSIGSTCNYDGECISGSCADGVCCNSDCKDPCKSCNQTGSVGTCNPLPSDSAPAHGSCGPDTMESCGRSGVCDGTGACRYWGTSVVCKAGSCDTNTNLNTADSKCDGAGNCITPTAIACDPYLCQPDGKACYGSCSGSGAGQCKAPNPCESGQCGPKVQGTPCGGDGECATGNCVDGVCCDQPVGSCSGCKQCNLASSLGLCTSVPKGQDPHSTCAQNDATCVAGGCSGAGQCQPSASSVTCNSSCSGGNQWTTRKCDGATSGACPATTGTVSCPSNLKCADGVSCAANCTTNGDSDCITGYYCGGSNCSPKKDLGQMCSGGNECLSSNCVDGVCCETSCDGQCQACDIPTGTGLGHCQTLTSGQPHGTRTACVGTGTCKGSCDGASPTACTMPTIQCADQKCMGSTLTQAAFCDGAGGCPAQTMVSCSPAVCNTMMTACVGSCTGDGECAGTAFCCLSGMPCFQTVSSQNQCITKLAVGGKCSGNAQCDNGNCVDGYCCDAACNGKCQACDIAGGTGVGHCQTVTTGQPHGARGACSGTGVCQGTCDGSSSTACGFSSSTQCSAQSCTGTTLTQPALCDGAGSCPTAA